MTALEELAQAVLDGRVRLYTTTVWSCGEPAGSEVLVLVDPPEQEQNS